MYTPLPILIHLYIGVYESWGSVGPEFWGFSGYIQSRDSVVRTGMLYVYCTMCIYIYIYYVTLLCDGKHCVWVYIVVFSTIRLYYSCVLLSICVVIANLMYTCIIYMHNQLIIRILIAINTHYIYI